jgi:hypothetical protein
MTAITTSGGITIVAPQKAGGLLADVQYLEPYASSALNRKAYGIFGAGVYQGFSVVPGKGLSVIVKPNGTKPGVASVDINGYQITVQLLTEQAVALVAGKLNIVILEAKYGQGIVTDQVDANSKIKAASLRVVNDEKSILDGMVEVCRINLASNATSVPAESINVDKRFSLKVSYESTDDINDARANRLLTVKAGKSFVPLAGGDMTGPLGVTRLVFSDKITTQANTDIDRANGFTVESLSATSPGYPVQGGLGTLLTFKVNEYRNVQFALGSGNTDFYLRSMRKDNGTSTEKWDRVYTQAFKPTAADVGALTDAQAAQKYALRSIKINGKPLSSDVNLLAGDVNAYNKTEADGRYLAKTSNLADLTDKAKARGNLELGDAATRNVGVAGGQLMAVGAFGLGVGGRHFDDAYCNTAQIYRLNASSANKPPITGNIAAGVISLPCDAAPSSGYLAISGLGIGYIGFSNRPENGVKWGQIYTTSNKPSAADVGALTDAQAAQKYALRSIKINGKPLSSDVNLLASDVNAWNKTESDGRYLKLTGDTMKGRLVIDGATVLPTQPLRALADSPVLWMHGLSVSTLEFDDPNIKGYPTQPYSTLVNFSATEHRGLQLLSEKGTNNFWLRSADAGKYSPFVNIYHTGNKPKAIDVDAVSASQGGEFMKEIIAKGGVGVPATGRSDPGGLYPGNGDQATFDACNLDIKSWFGIGFVNTCPVTGIQGRSAILNVRTGDFTTKGNVRAVNVLDSSGRVYSPGNKPSAADVGALTDAQAAQKYALRSIKVNGKPLTADVNLQAGDVNAYNKTESDSRYFARGMTGTSADVAWNAPSGFYSTQATGMTSVLHFHLGGAGSTRSADFRFNYGNGGIAYRSSRDGFGYEKGWTKIYTELDKPKPADIGTLDTAELTDNYGAIAKLKIDTASNPTWILIGTISNLVQFGSILTIDVFGGSGYNAAERNNASQRIMIRTNNGAVAKINDPFRALVTSHHYGQPTITEVRAIEVTANKYEIYALVGAFTKNVVTSVNSSVKMSNWAYSFTVQDKVPEQSIRFISNVFYHSGNKPTAEDVDAWSKSEADGRFLMLSGGTVKGDVGANKIVFPGSAVLDASADIKRKSGFTIESFAGNAKGYPIDLGTLVSFTIGENRNAQLAIGSGGGSAFYFRSLRIDSPGASEVWDRVYTQAFKPTAADVGALTDAQAAQKYALRSIKINGKPLSSDVNLLAGDVNAWNKTESDGRYLGKSGGNLSGAVSSTSWFSATSHRVPSGAAPEGSGAYSAQLDSKAPFYQENFDWEVNNGGLYVPLIKGRSNRKGQGYPTAISFGYLLEGTPGFAKPCIHVKGDNTEATWSFDPQSKQFYSPGNLIAGGAIFHADGNSSGNIWGGYLSNWLNNQLNARDNNINNRVDWGTYNRDVGARATVDWVNQNFIQNVRYSAETQVGATGVYTYHDNTVLTGFNNRDGDYSAEQLFWSYIQIYKNGQWITIGR